MKINLKDLKILIEQVLYESNNDDFKNDVLNFIKKYLNIKSDITIIHTKKSFDNESMTQQMASVTYKYNRYIVYINFNETQFGFVRRLAHELIHVKQMEDGRLKIIGDKISFDGEVYTEDDYERMYHSDDIPKFEEEAFEQERIISNLYWKKNTLYRN